MPGLVDRVVDVLPAGADLPIEEFERRHGAILCLVWAQSAAVLVFGLVRGVSLPMAGTEALIICLLGAVAAIKVLAPRFRANLATLALITTSSVIVQFAGGSIEAHFHFFVMLAVIAIYQDWIPFLLAILYVALDHGVVGTLYPHTVYNHPDAIAHPWQWALIHAGFVLGEAAALLAGWNAIEATEQQKRFAIEQAAERRRAAERSVMIQRHLLPQATPRIEGYELVGVCRPAQDVAGDFYDWVASTDGALDLTVADVMGKGVAAALVMAVLQTALRSAPPQLDLPGRVSAAAGSLPRGMTEEGLFVTLFHARLDAGTGVLRYVDAGHGYWAIRRRSGELVSLPRRFLPLGVRSDEVYQEGIARLEPGDALVVYSDGLVEVDGGTAELADYLDGLDHRASATELMGGIMKRTLPRPSDDVTVVVLRRRLEDEEDSDLPDRDRRPGQRPMAHASSPRMVDSATRGGDPR